MPIRPLQASDNAAYTTLWINALTEHEKHFRVALEDDAHPQIPTQFSAESFTLGAFAGDNLVGTLSFVRETRFKTKHKALLMRMYVHPSADGQGIGKALIQATISLARNLIGLRQLYLTVLASNQRAIRLYTSSGFSPFAQEPESVNIQGQYIDELQMVCFLSKCPP